MNKLLVVFIMLAIALSSCKERKKDVIAKQETVLTESAKTGKIDTVAVKALLTEYEKFAVEYPTDTTTAVYLFKAADFYRYMHQPEKSIELYNKVYTDFPTFGRRPYALFLQGFIYENEMGNPHEAKRIYEKFLAEFPNNVMARDVRAALMLLGKTPEQIVAEFQESAGRDSIANANTTPNP